MYILAAIKQIIIAVYVNIGLILIADLIIGASLAISTVYGTASLDLSATQCCDHMGMGMAIIYELGTM